MEEWHDNHREKRVMGNCQRKLRQQVDRDEGGQGRAGIRLRYHEEWHRGKHQTKKTTTYQLC